VREALALWRWSNPWRINVLITACLLMLRSLAALSSSSSMEAVKSTFTRWMGFLISPELVKNRETSLPLSAIRAMDSAETSFFLSAVFFIAFPLRGGCFPQGHQMVELSFCVFPDLKNHRVQTASHPTDGTMLSGEVRTLVGVIGMKENLLYFLEANSALWIPPKAFALSLIEMESHKV
jgi:hypothetical protein